MIDIATGLPNPNNLKRIAKLLGPTFVVEQFMLILKGKIKVKNPYNINDQKMMFIIWIKYLQNLVFPQIVKYFV